MNGKVAFLTNAREYAGPPAAAALVKAGWEVFCHDDAFSSADARTRYELDFPCQIASAALDSTSFVSEGLHRFGRIDALISNDIPKRTMPVLEVTDLLQDFEAHVDSLLIEPVRLLRTALPIMKAARSGSIVFVTSGAPLRTPMAGGAHGYSVARAAANALTKKLAVELAPFNIQVNAVAPAPVYSQTFFPSEIGAEDPKFVPLLTKMVPMKRFGRPEEIGCLIAFLTSGEIGFVSGQVIAFSGGGC